MGFMVYFLYTLWQFLITSDFMALRDCKFERTYKTDEVGNDGMGHFYQAALKNSIKWRAASGYFTSSFLELFK